MSMSIDTSIRNSASGYVQQRANEAAAELNKTNGDRPQFDEKLEALKKIGVESAAQRRRQQSEAMAERLTTRAEAVTARFEAISTRWSERFIEQEAKALERGNDLVAESISRIGERLTKQLDKMSERFVNLLSKSYGAIGDDSSNPEDPGVDKVA